MEASRVRVVPPVPVGAADDPVRAAYGQREAEYTALLGSVGDMHQLDRLRIARWAAGIEGQVLDAGCGPGHWTDFLQQQGARVQGIDMVPEFINRASARFPGVAFKVSSMRHLDLADGSLAGVLAWYSLIHFTPAELPLVLSELRRVLKPRGHLLAGFFNGRPGEPFDHAVTTAYFWSVGRMSRMLNEAGFEVVHVETRQDPRSRPHAAIAAVLADS